MAARLTRMEIPSDIPGECIYIAKTMYEKAIKKVVVTDRKVIGNRLIIEYTTKGGRGGYEFL